MIHSRDGLTKFPDGWLKLVRPKRLQLFWASCTTAIHKTRKSRKRSGTCSSLTS
jgi:hypothetical protein